VKLTTHFHLFSKFPLRFHNVMSNSLFRYHAKNGPVYNRDRSPNCITEGNVECHRFIRMTQLELEITVITMFLLLMPPLLLFITINISNSTIILTPRSNTFHPYMVVHLVRKFSAFCSKKLHCRLHNRPSIDCIPSLFNSVL
jgi:hypothetical protein